MAPTQAVPVVVPTAPPPATGGGVGGGKNRGVMVAAAIVAAVLLVGGIAFAVGSGDKPNDDVDASYDDDTDVSTTRVTTTTDDDDDEGNDRTTTTQDRTTTTVRRTTTTAAPASRMGSLFTDYAKLRSGPYLTAGEVAVLESRDGDQIEIFGAPTSDGWYEVTVDGNPGYLFGAFVLPPAPGYCVYTSSNAEPAIWDDYGMELIDVEKSGNKVLTTSSVSNGGYLPVILPDATRGWVWAGDVSKVACG